MSSLEDSGVGETQKRLHHCYCRAAPRKGDCRIPATLAVKVQDQSGHQRSRTPVQTSRLDLSYTSSGWTGTIALSMCEEKSFALFNSCNHPVLPQTQLTRCPVCAKWQRLSSTLLSCARTWQPVSSSNVPRRGGCAGSSRCNAERNPDRTGLHVPMTANRYVLTKARFCKAASRSCSDSASLEPR